MDKKTTVFLAKKLFTELVFNTAYIEGVNVTFPQTQTILDPDGTEPKRCLALLYQQL